MGLLQTILKTERIPKTKMFPRRESSLSKGWMQSRKRKGEAKVVKQNWTEGNAHS
ncbi:hypothetical protein A2U01_0070609 [Trifolium medium]|uniref:Uncharacterized protein n=1 Tax=Trifolium medium TaxID=97028 RepID=A0A392SMY9_9FABA|nr:hypothetical protein [Trifolium medium]